MLSFTTTIDELVTHIHYPVASQVARYLLKELGLLEYMGNKIYINSVFHSPSRSSSEVRRVILNEPGFTATVRLHTNPTGTRWEMLNVSQAMDARIVRRDTLHPFPILQDKDNFIYLAEKYLPCGIEMECRLQFVDKTTAYDVMTRMYSTIGNNNFVVPINLSYNYRIPMPMLRSLWHLAYLTGIKKEEFVPWLQAKSNNQISKLVGKNKRSRAMELVVNKHQFESYVATEYSSDEPEIQTAGTSADKIILSFTTYVQFARTNLLYLEYPIVVNNRLVPESMVTVPRDNRFTPFVKLARYGYSDIDTALQASKLLLKNPVHSPWYDVWSVPTTSPHGFYRAIPFYIGVFTLDEVKCACGKPDGLCCCPPGRTSIDIVDLDKYRLSDTVLSYFKENKDKCLDVGAKYNITVFADNTLIDKKSITFDGTTFSISNSFGKRRIYRFVIAKTPEQPTEQINTFFMLDCILEVSRKE